MLFRKKIERACSYCAHGTIVDCDRVLCVKKGVVPIDAKCRKFCYDPCKRIPAKPKALDVTQYEDGDFSL